MCLTEYAYAKINFLLDVLDKRNDGYHNVKMIMQTIDLSDKVVIKPAKELFIETIGANLPSDGRNIAFQAASLMGKEASKNPDFLITIEKKIPLAAGLAGGSADAAAVIRALNKIWNLNWPLEKLEQIGAQIGSDVPFCIKGGTALAEGRGEILTSLPDSPNMYLVVACPEIEVSTAWVYQNYRQDMRREKLDINGALNAIEKDNLEDFASKMGNALENITIKKHAVIDEIKGIMTEHGAMKSLMSGSGPSVFAVIETKEKALTIAEALKKVVKNISVTKPRRKLWKD